MQTYFLFEEAIYCNIALPSRYSVTVSPHPLCISGETITVLIYVGDSKQFVPFAVHRQTASVCTLYYVKISFNEKFLSSYICIYSKERMCSLCLRTGGSFFNIFIKVLTIVYLHEDYFEFEFRYVIDNHFLPQKPDDKTEKIRYPQWGSYNHRFFHCATPLYIGYIYSTHTFWFMVTFITLKYYPFKLLSLLRALQRK